MDPLSGYLSSQQGAAPLIEQALRKLNNPDGWRSLVETARRFPTQSPENQLLIASHSTRLTRGRQPTGSLEVVRNVPLFLVTPEEAAKRAGNSAGQQVKVIGTNGSGVKRQIVCLVGVLGLSVKLCVCGGYWMVSFLLVRGSLVGVVSVLLGWVGGCA